MKILVTGAKGFIGKNLISELHNQGYQDIYEYDKDTDPDSLEKFCYDCDFVFNLAGVNRPENPDEFMKGNYCFVTRLLETLKKYQNTCPVMVSSSIQATLDNPYGKSKKAGEDLIFSYAKETGAKVYIYRFPNVFGKWCRPNYNSAVATFCHNIANDLPIQVNDRTVVMNLVYIDDVVEELVNILKGKATCGVDGYYYVPIVHSARLGDIVDLIYSFKESRETKKIPDMTDGCLVKKLYSTYLSYIPEDQFSYPLKMHKDERGSFTEILKTEDRGQFSVNISKPGIEKGNHWHKTKNEKFVVVSGSALIQLRKIGCDRVIEYYVSGEKLEVIDIPVGFTHNIVNVGDTDLITFMWCNECFDPEKPDTFYLPVIEEI